MPTVGRVGRCCTPRYRARGPDAFMFPGYIGLQPRNIDQVHKIEATCATLAAYTGTVPSKVLTLHMIARGECHHASMFGFSR